MAENSVIIYLGLEWKEEVISQDEKYTYLKAYSERAYNVTTTLYRTNNPFVMQRINSCLPSADSNWSEDSTDSSDANQDITDNSTNGASNSASDETAGESATDNGISDSDSYSSELEQYQLLETR